MMAEVELAQARCPARFPTVEALTRCVERRGRALGAPCDGLGVSFSDEASPCDGLCPARDALCAPLDALSSSLDALGGPLDVVFEGWRAGGVRFVERSG